LLITISCNEISVRGWFHLRREKRFSCFGMGIGVSGSYWGIGNWSLYQFDWIVQRRCLWSREDAYQVRDQK